MTYSPEVVHQHVEDAQDDNQQSRTPLRLEANNNHDTRDQADDGDEDPPDGPLSTEHEAHEQEDEEHATRELEVHLAILLLQLGQAGKRLRLLHPGVGEHHQEAAHDGQVAQEEVEVEDQAVAERLRDDDANEARDGVFGVSSGDDEYGACYHRDHVDDEEDVGETVRDWKVEVSRLSTKRTLSPQQIGPSGGLGLTVTVVMQVEKLVAPLCHYAQGVFEESHDDEEPADRGHVTVKPAVSICLLLLACVG